jgi:hypothetical protein
MEDLWFYANCLQFLCGWAISMLLLVHSLIRFQLILNQNAAFRFDKVKHNWTQKCLNLKSLDILILEVNVHWWNIDMCQHQFGLLKVPYILKMLPFWRIRDPRRAYFAVWSHKYLSHEVICMHAVTVVLCQYSKSDGRFLSCLCAR